MIFADCYVKKLEKPVEFFYSKLSCQSTANVQRRPPYCRSENEKTLVMLSVGKRYYQKYM